MEFRVLCQIILFSIYMHCIISAETEINESLPNLREYDTFSTTENTAVGTTIHTFRQSRWYRRGYNDQQINRGEHNDDEDDDHDMDNDNDDDDDDDDDNNIGNMKAITESKGEYWNGYYDFLINEGSYKFWAVFQLATAALLIYSGFAALYYAKVNPPSDDDYEDYFLRRKRRSYNTNPCKQMFCGLSPETFQRIIDAVERGIR